MSNADRKELPELPVKLNLYDFLEWPRFADSVNGQKAINAHKKSIRNGYIAKIILWVVLVIIVLFLFNSGRPFWALIIAFLGGSFALGLTRISVKANADAKLQQIVSQHCGAVAEYLIENYFNDATYFYFFTEALIYNNNLCAYISTDSGEFVVYDKANIKDVSRERIHVGSQAISTAATRGKSKRTWASSLKLDPFRTRNQKSTTNVVTHSLEIYEWHFDILTDFMEHPKVTLILPDDKFAEDEIGKAYGVLKP